LKYDNLNYNQPSPSNMILVHHGCIVKEIGVWIFWSKDSGYCAGTRQFLYSCCPSNIMPITKDVCGMGWPDNLVEGW